MGEEIKKIMPSTFEVFPIDTHFVFKKVGRPHQVYIKYQPKSRFKAQDYFTMARDQFARLT